LDLNLSVTRAFRDKLGAIADAGESPTLSADGGPPPASAGPEIAADTFAAPED
jgi:hypothetical protein